MHLLVMAEIPSGEKTHSYSFRLGVKYRDRGGDFDSSGYRNHAVAGDAGKEIRFDCGVDCEGGEINVALSKDDKSAIIRLARITIWQRNKPDDEAGDALLAGASDKIFRQESRGHARLRKPDERPQGTRSDQAQMIRLPDRSGA
jgi:hypothetical protein